MAQDPYRTENRKNVLLISTDHWPGPLLGAEGHPVIQTPTVDEIARTGIRFDRAYSECPVCIPARRTLMTGTTPRTHGDRIFDQHKVMPDFPTLAQTFRDAGYQAYAVGKLHVFPQRNRIGFDDVLLSEEGRGQHGVIDDYELFLGDQGYPGQQFNHGMANNQYVTRPWHLPEELHNTNWTATQMERFIRRRDPTRPAFFYMSFAHPHPPLAPLACYMDLYRRLEMDTAAVGKWADEIERLPPKLRKGAEYGEWLSHEMRLDAQRAFYALVTHIDHQIRRVIGTLREEDLLKDTYIMFTSDHGEMLGHHNLWAKRCFYEWSARVPMILTGPAGDPRLENNSVDSRLVGLQDVMPTLLDLCSIPIPDTVEGVSMLGEARRDHLYGEEAEGPRATRMIHDGRYKLIYYAGGNETQLFDLEEDPDECRDLAGVAACREIRERLTAELIANLHGSDLDWLQDGVLTGLPASKYEYRPAPGLFGQRGTHWPPQPSSGVEIKDLDLI
jgi:arylsulfatase